VTRSVIQRRVLLPLLVLYAAIVVLAAWRHEIRPAFLDPPAAWARSVLGLAGIPPGVPVFTSETDTLPDEKIAVQCLEVRGVAVDGAARRIHPAGGRVCPAPSPRLWVRGEDIALSRFVMGMRSGVASRREGTLAPSRVRVPRLLADSMAEHFRKRTGAEGLAPDRYALLWTESRVSYRTGARSERIVALVRWRADPGEGVFVSWRPDERTLREYWPALGQP
jgi:hypothetical protein